jgi:hypothetical protein
MQLRTIIRQRGIANCIHLINLDISFIGKFNTYIVYFYTLVPITTLFTLLSNYRCNNNITFNRIPDCPMCKIKLLNIFPSDLQIMLGF